MTDTARETETTAREIKPSHSEIAAKLVDDGLNADRMHEDMRARMIEAAKVHASLAVAEQLRKLNARLDRGLQVDTGR